MRRAAGLRSRAPTHGLRRLVLGGEQVEQLLQELAVAPRELLERRLLQPVARRAELGRTVAGRRELGEVEQLLRVRAERERHVGRGQLLVGHGGVGREGARHLLQLGEALRDAGALAPARASGRVRPSAASRRRPSASCAAPGRRRSRAGASAPGRARRRTTRAPARTPRRAARPPGRRRARGSAGRARPRTDACAAGASRSRGWSRSTRRRAAARGRAGRARAAPHGCVRATHRPPCACR